MYPSQALGTYPTKGPAAQAPILGGGTAPPEQRAAEATGGAQTGQRRDGGGERVARQNLPRRGCGLLWNLRKTVDVASPTFDNRGILWWPTFYRGVSRTRGVRHGEERDSNGPQLEESTPVKMIIAIIQPTKLSALREALVKIGVERMTVCDAQGYGRQLGHTESYRGVEYKTNLLRKIALEIAVNDDFLDRTIETIESVARTGPEGNIGDGKIFVLPLEHVTRIGGVATGPGAV